MTRWTCRLILWSAAWLGTATARLAADSPTAPAEVLLWSEGAPGAVGTEALDQPSIRIYQPTTANGTAVVVCPGGGYGGLAIDHEGHQVAQWFNSFGVTAVVLKYRLAPRYRHPSPLLDVQRAIRHVRANAEALKVSAKRIGVMGFSAGGHLASTVSTHFDAGKADATDPTDRVSCRPDFSILAYPVIDLLENFAHKGSAKNLLGDNPDPELLKSLCNQTQVSDQTPPTFLFHTTGDSSVPPQNSLVYYAACVAHKVPCELHIYQNGPHGVGLASGDPVLGTWKERLADWLKSNGLLAEGERAAVKGKVSLKGKAIHRGMITFQPANTSQPTASAMIHGGTFSIAKPQGAIVGKQQVAVTFLTDIAPNPTGTPIKLPVVEFEILTGENELNLNLQ